MKKLFLLTVTALCIMASCSKDSWQNSEKDLTSGFGKGIPANVPLVTYSPAADGDDTDELKALLTNAEPGSVIKLSPGEYHVGAIELYGFNGKIIGSGRDKTVIFPAGLIEVDPLYNIRNLIPNWWLIIGGDITISDLTFKTGDGALISDTDPVFKKSLATLIAVNNYSADYYPENPPFMNFKIENVNFISGSLKNATDAYLELGDNLVMPLWIGTVYWFIPEEGIKLTKGKYDVLNCYFKDAMQGPEFFSFGVDATGTIDKLITENAVVGAYFAANYDSRISITNGTFKNSQWSDIAIEDNDFGLFPDFKSSRRCQFVISGNSFNTSLPIPSVVLRDYFVLLDNPDKWPMQVILKGNLFNLTGGSTGISAMNSQNLQIRNNRFSGMCEAGIIVDGQEVTLYDFYYNVIATGTPWAKNALILGNNFNGLKPTTAAVVLGEKSMNCTVIGTGKAKVIDNGTDNKITGMNKQHGGHHFGPSIKDNFRIRHRMGH